MNMHNLTFPTVAKYHEPGNDVGTTSLCIIRQVQLLLIMNQARRM